MISLPFIILCKQGSRTLLPAEGLQVLPLLPDTETTGRAWTSTHSQLRNEASLPALQGRWHRRPSAQSGWASCPLSPAATRPLMLSVKTTWECSKTSLPPSQRGIRWGRRSPNAQPAATRRDLNTEWRSDVSDFHWLRMRYSLLHLLGWQHRGSQQTEGLNEIQSLSIETLKCPGFHQKSLIIPRTRKLTN